MRILLDSHVVIWWLTNPSKLRKAAFAALVSDDSELFVSAASWWELSIERSLGKLRFDAESILAKFAQADVGRLNVTFAHAERAAGLPAHHSDPFDRMLAAQALSENCTLMTRDTTLASYGVATMTA